MSEGLVTGFSGTTPFWFKHGVGVWALGKMIYVYSWIVGYLRCCLYVRMVLDLRSK